MNEKEIHCARRPRKNPSFSPLGQKPGWGDSPIYFLAMIMRTRMLLTGLIACGFLLFAVPGTSQSRPQVVDCIVAVVNKQVITLTDLRLADRFGLYEIEGKAAAATRPARLLDKLIDQKVVLDLAAGNKAAEKTKVENSLEDLIGRLGPEKARAELEAFGLTPEDLNPYLEEKILYETIIAERFAQSSSVNLKEIEAYYAETYVPAQKKLGLEPRPMIALLDTIESEIKRIKAEAQVALWIKNLRKQAEIEIRTDCLNKYKESL
jgi:hypothetical protein